MWPRNMPQKVVWRKNPLEQRDFHRECGAQTPTFKSFVAYELRLLWNTNSDFYARWAVFSGGGGGLQYNLEVRKRVVSKRVVLADVPQYRKPGTRVHSDVPWYQKTQNEGTFGCSPVPKPGTRVHSREPPFYETALMFPLEYWLNADIYREGPK